MYRIEFENNYWCLYKKVSETEYRRVFSTPDKQFFDIYVRQFIFIEDK